MNKAFTSDEFINLITDRDKSERLLVEESIIKDTYLEGFDMTNITFKLCSFENCNLRGADFSGSSISGTLFRECPMHGCRFVGSDMTEAIFRDIPVKAYYPDAEELAALNYRQKKELTGAIRIVELEGVDCCACCAPHVARSSEVGILKILSAMNYKGGTRLYIACGMRAVNDYATRIREAQQLSKLLSAPQGELSAAVARLQEKAVAAEQRAAETALALILARAEAEIREKAQTHEPPKAEEDGICLILPPLPESALQRAVKPLREAYSGLIALFSGDDDGGYSFLLVGDGVDWKPFLTELRARGGKGGGGKDRVQGRIFCAGQELKPLLHDFVIK